MLKTTRFLLMIMAMILSSGYAFSQPNFVTIEVNFASAPGSATSTIADLKYNKQGVFNYEIDDRGSSFRDVFAFFHGGFAPVNGVYYSGKSYTDGAGNPVKWTAALASNARVQSNNLDYVTYNNSPSWAEMANYMKYDFMIENHGYFHNKFGTYSNGNNTWKNIDDNTKYIRDSLAVYGVHFTTRVLVVPNGDGGYVQPADGLRYLAAVAQAPLDGYSIYPQWVDGPLSISSLPNGFLLLNRGLTDSWSQGNIDWYRTVITDRFISGMSPSNKKMWRFAGHYFSDAAAFQSFVSLMEELETQSADRVWMTTLQEFLEYLETKRLVVKSEQLSGNKLTIRLDLSAVPDVNRFRDLSLLVNANTPITSVTVAGADRMTYNPSTGLINIFKRSSGSVPMVVLPLSLEQFSAAKDGNASVVSWSASFDQATNFVIERSTDGNNFSEIGSHNAPVRSNGVQNFSYRDANPASGKNYYRLKYSQAGQADKHSQVVVLQFGSKEKMSLYPNPAKGDLVNLEFAKPISGNMELTFVNANGMVVQKTSIPGSRRTKFEVKLDQKLAPGTYLLEVKYGSVKESAKFVLQ